MKSERIAVDFTGGIVAFLVSIYYIYLREFVSVSVHPSVSSFVPELLLNSKT